MATKKNTKDYNQLFTEMLDVAFSGKARVDFGEDGSVVVRVGDIGVSFKASGGTPEFDTVIARLKDEIFRKFIKGA